MINYDYAGHFAHDHSPRRPTCDTCVTYRERARIPRGSARAPRRRTRTRRRRSRSPLFRDDAGPSRPARHHRSAQRRHDSAETSSYRNRIEGGNRAPHRCNEAAARALFLYPRSAAGRVCVRVHRLLIIRDILRAVSNGQPPGRRRYQLSRRIFTAARC